MSENVEKTAGQLALEECEKAYADMTATEVELGFGDCHVDWRDPLAQVAIYKKAMDEVADETEYKTYAYTPEGEELTADEAKAKAETFHQKTPGKIEKEEAAAGKTEEGEGSQPSEGSN